jgi:transposase-like protein
MELNLHANATTTPKVRAYIQRSRRPVADLATELGVSETTIRRWRGRTTVSDHSHTPKTLQTSFSPMEETLICELRTQLQLPLDDIVEVMRRCVNDKLSRSAVHRCLKRHGLSHRPKPDKPSVGVFEQAPVGFIHIDLKHLPALERRKSYAFVAIDRATRYVYLEIHPKRDAETSAGFLERFLAHFPHAVHAILTDNGAEFTDRFAVDMKNKPRTGHPAATRSTGSAPNEASNTASPDLIGRRPTAWSSASTAVSSTPSAANPSAVSRGGCSGHIKIVTPSSIASSMTTIELASNASITALRSKSSKHSPISRDQTRSQGRRQLFLVGAYAAICREAARPASASASLSRSSGLIRKPSMPASKQA